MPLSYAWSVEPLHELLEELVAADRAPIYVVHFTQAAANERAQALLSAKLCTREEREAIADAIGGFRFTAGFGRTLSQARAQRHRRPPRRHAAAVPAAGRAARADRPAQGDLRDRHAGRRHQRADPHGRLHRPGEVRRHEHRLLKAREFHQIAGRAGRAGLRHSRARRRPGARARHRDERARWPRPATTRRSAARSRGRSRRRRRWSGRRRRSSGCAARCPRRSSPACASTTR